MPQVVFKPKGEGENLQSAFYVIIVHCPNETSTINNFIWHSPRTKQSFILPSESHAGQTVLEYTVFLLIIWEWIMLGIENANSSDIICLSLVTDFKHLYSCSPYGAKHSNIAKVKNPNWRGLTLTLNPKPDALLLQILMNPLCIVAKKLNSKYQEQLGQAVVKRVLILWCQLNSSLVLKSLNQTASLSNNDLPKLAFVANQIENQYLSYLAKSIIVCILTAPSRWTWSSTWKLKK